MGFDMWPSLVEGTRAVKSLLWDHPLKIYSGGTGSDHINATNPHAIEDAVQRIGRELHSQYWVSYRPNNLQGEAYHTLEVKVNRLRRESPCAARICVRAFRRRCRGAGKTAEALAYFSKGWMVRSTRSCRSSNAP